MSNGSDKPSMTAPLGGVVVGVVTFVLANIVAGRAIVPTTESATNVQHGMSEIVYPQDEVAASDAPAGGTYQTVCQTCHQAEGEGVAGAFPPLAGSEWVTGDPETPIRIAILGLTGPIEVKGVQYNSAMPPPPGLTDEQIVEAVNHIRTNFGNNASEVDVELVKSVRASLEGRTKSWTAEELIALRGAAPAADAGTAEGEAAEGEGAEGEAPEGEAAPAEAPAEGEAAPAEGAAPAAPDKEAAE